MIQKKQMHTCFLDFFIIPLSQIIGFETFTKAL